jgi:hypothetical protein
MKYGVRQWLNVAGCGKDLPYLTVGKVNCEMGQQ